MDSSTSDSFFTSDSDIGPSGNYNFNSQQISPIAIFLILILLLMLIGFFINNLSINNFEPNLEKYKSEHKSEHKLEHKPEQKSEQKQNIHDNMHPSVIKKSLEFTNQELNNSINKLADLVNTTSNEIKSTNGQEIKDLEKTIDDLKSEMIILQSKLLDNELQKSEEKINEKTLDKSTDKSSKNRVPNINIITDHANPSPSYTYNNFQDDVVIYDPIANYDRLKLTDPLVDPRGRSSADQIPTPQVAAQLNFPTQGVLDRYHRVGLLIALDNDSNSSAYYDKTNRFDDFYGNQNNKSGNILETNSDYSAASYSSNSPTYPADNNRKYNGVEIMNSKSNSRHGSTLNPYTNTSNTSNTSNTTNTTNTSNPYSNANPNPYSNSNSNSNVDSIFTVSGMSISSLSSPKPLSNIVFKSKSKKHNKSKKHLHKKENFEMEGFTNEINYENFESSDSDSDLDVDETNVDYNTDVYANVDSTPGNNNNFKKKYPYFDKYDYELDAGTDINNLNSIDGFNSVEGFGNLNNVGHKNNLIGIANNENGILELIGKKITDNWYKYFTSISVGNKIIKINVHHRIRRELYDGDIVYISELGKRYKVKIDKMDMIEYNPYFF